VRAFEITAQPALQDSNDPSSKNNPIVTNYVLGVLDRTAERGVKGNAVLEGKRGIFVNL
jgi:hypothetical protein